MMLLINLLTITRIKDSEEEMDASNAVKMVTLQKNVRTAEWMIVVAREIITTMPVTSVDRLAISQESAQMVLNSKEIEGVTSVINQVTLLVSAQIKMVKTRVELTNVKEEMMEVLSRELLMVRTVEILRDGIMIRQTTVVPQEMTAGTTENASAKGCKN